MLKTLLKNTRFTYEIGEFYKKYRKEIVDIILFGSVTRGGRTPKDLDILIIFKDKENLDISYELRKILEKLNLGLKIEITTRTYKNLFDSTFLPRENVLSEGYSLILKKKIAEGFGYKSFTLFIYSLKNFSNSQRMMFQYALHGRRKTRGILQEIGGVKFTITSILIPIKSSEKFEEFLNSWKIDYKKLKILIPARSVEFKEFRL